MLIKVLGAGCRKCKELEANTLAAIKELSLDGIVEHVNDFSQIAAYGVMSTPALVVDEKVVSAGKLLSKKEIMDLLGRAG